MIFVNSEELSGFEGVSVLELIEKRKYKTAFVAVELNGKIVPRAEYESTVLKDGDKLEVVSFVGGG
ncbi:MAG: sulfur carrier protein ThiS [Clostridiales bacterium]|nr:sulfur carrier protein ThiS [Clostridiales bacterium]